MDNSLTANPARLETFTERARAAGAMVYRPGRLAEAARIVAGLAAAQGQARVAVAPEQAALDDNEWQSWLAEVAGQVEIVPLEQPAEIAATGVGLSRADLAVAETGSVVFASNDRPARLVAMLTYIHVVLVRSGQMVAGLDEAGRQIRDWQAGPGDRRYISMVTGPSRTADIERVLTIGVQGPQELHIILLD